MIPLDVVSGGFEMVCNGRLACSRRSDSGARAKNKASERAGKKRGETSLALVFARTPLSDHERLEQANGRRVAVIFSEGLEVFSFSIMKSSFCFTDVEIIAVPATGFVNYFRFLRTIQAVLVWKERFDAAIILKNYLEVGKRIEIVYT